MPTEFVAAKANISFTTVWVHILGLPIEYFDETILVEIGKLIGTPLKVDIHTAWTTRGKFARICVEIDLNKPLLSKVRIGKKIFNVEYEGLHAICFQCGMVGHRASGCPIRSPEDTQTREEREDPPRQEEQQNQEEVKEPENIPAKKELSKDLNKERFGPWMLVQRKQRGTRRNSKNKGTSQQDNRHGNRFAALNNANPEEINTEIEITDHEQEKNRDTPYTSKIISRASKNEGGKPPNQPAKTVQSERNVENTGNEAVRWGKSPVKDVMTIDPENGTFRQEVDIQRSHTNPNQRDTNMDIQSLEIQVENMITQ
ncbi:uncharacterized protein LOC120136524 [Hibiscus syriacus]|uniref:uncharacterized protein LOC120136524 n=1 Tax=Hibiscus syriacus TaxID=106335 RepID=UPI001925002C|nr:uncharacterized protein LOC120136524 [Hibiscus syriacus]